MKNILFLLLFISVVGYSQQSTVYTRYTGVISDTLNIPQVNGIVYWNPITGYLMYREGNTWKKVSTAGSGGISGLTAARIPFAATSTTLGDDSNLIWNNTLKNLGVGGVATHQLTVRATSNNKNVFLVEDDSGNDAISIAEVGSVLNTVISGTNLTLNPTGNLVSGKKHSFTPNATYAGLNLGQYSDHPANPDLGDVYYNTTVDSLYFYLNGAWEALQGNLRGTLSVARIPFAIGVHALGDDSQLGWDNSLKSLGIGQTGGGNSQLTIQSTSANRSMFNVRENDSGGAPTPFEISEVSDLTKIRVESDTFLIKSDNTFFQDHVSQDDTKTRMLAIDATTGKLHWRDESTIGGGSGTVTEVTLDTSGEGLSISNPTVTTSGTITIIPDDDLAAVEGLSSTGFPTRITTNTWAQRTMTSGNGINVTNGNGVSGNPTFTLSNSINTSDLTWLLRTNTTGRRSQITVGQSTGNIVHVSTNGGSSILSLSDSEMLLRFQDTGTSDERSISATTTSDGIVVTDALGDKGFTYADDYSANFTARSLPDSAFIASMITAGAGSGTVESVGLSTGTSGTDVNVSGSPVTESGTITLNIPTASGTNTGKLSSTDWSTFNGKQAALVSGTNIKTVNSTTLLGSGNLVVGTVTSVGMTDITGLTFSGDPVTSSGNITPSLANDLAALEGMPGTGIVTRTASETYAQRTLTAGNGISISNGNGVSGNPTISIAGGAENNYTEFSLSSADILSLGGASTGDGITVVAAPGAGKYIKVISAIAYLDHNGSDYANASQTKLGYDTGSVILSQGFNDTNINQNADFIFEHLENATVIAWAASAVINKPLVFHCIGTPTDGNGTLKLYIHYQIVTL